MSLTETGTPSRRPCGSLRCLGIEHAERIERPLAALGTSQHRARHFDGRKRMAVVLLQQVVR
jgi:hypothetical protein